MKTNAFSIAKTFGIEGVPEELTIQGYHEGSPFVPRLDQHYLFRKDLLSDILAWHMLGGLALAERDAAEAERCFAEAARLERWNALLFARELQVLRAPDDPQAGWTVGRAPPGLLVESDIGDPGRLRVACIESHTPAAVDAGDFGSRHGEA